MNPRMAPRTAVRWSTMRSQGLLALVIKAKNYSCSSSRTIPEETLLPHPKNSSVRWDEVRLKQPSSLAATWKTRTSELGKAWDARAAILRASTVTRGRRTGWRERKASLTRPWFCFLVPHLWESALCDGCDLFGGGQGLFDARADCRASQVVARQKKARKAAQILLDGRQPVAVPEIVLRKGTRPNRDA